jgi:alkylhydroperoxidase family enzyme
MAMHADLARTAGVPQSKLDTVGGWREDGQFTSRERLALELTESLTTDLTRASRMSCGPAPSKRSTVVSSPISST